MDSKRREFLKAGSAFAGVAALTGCSTALPRQDKDPVPDLAPLRLRADRVVNITVCTRPFRGAGPRQEIERIGTKPVIHNYGHGGSGWSLSWGAAAIVERNLRLVAAQDVAIIGCGAMGLTAAIAAQRAGFPVTIYAKEWPPEVRSSFATGVFTPDSRICLAEHAAAFAQTWEEMCRHSFRVYQNYLGLPGFPIEWFDRYSLRDDDGPVHGGALAQAPEGVAFASFFERIKDITPRSEELPRGSHPFPVAHVYRQPNLLFNVTELSRMLLSDFLAAGGKLVTREFHGQSEFAELRESAVVNCTGYAARDLCKDESVVPVRGQVAHLIPQPEINYGIGYRFAAMVPRRDGLVVQNFKSTGYNDATTEIDRAETNEAIALLTGVSPTIQRRR